MNFAKRLQNSRVVIPTIVFDIFFVLKTFLAHVFAKSTFFVKLLLIISVLLLFLSKITLGARFRGKILTPAE